MFLHSATADSELRGDENRSSSNVTLCCSQGSLAGCRSAQCICIIHMKTDSAPGKPNSILKSRCFVAGPYFFTVQTVVTVIHQLSFDSPGSTDTIGTHVITSVTSLTGLWWGVCHGRMRIDWPDLTVYRFHPLCGQPKASDLLFYCPFVLWGSK